MALKIDLESADSNLLRHCASIARGQTAIDLRDCRWVDPYGLVLLMCLVDAASRASRVTVRAPSRTDTANYLSRMDLPEIVEGLGGDCSGFRPVRHHDVGTRLVECAMFASPSDFEDLKELLQARLDEEGWPIWPTLTVCDCLDEIADNLETHAGAERGFLAAQTYPAKRSLIFAVGDAGVGIRANIPARDDGEAIERAMQENVSSLDDPHRGYGFSHMQDFVKELRGTLSVRSCGGRVDLSQGAGTVRRTVPFQQGTIVAVRVPTQGW